VTLRSIRVPTGAVVAVGVLVRVLVLLAVVPEIQTVWFVPFFDHAVSQPSWDPWQSYLDAGGDRRAFPYGPVMLAVFGVPAALTAWLPEPWRLQAGLAVALLLIELTVWWLLARWHPRRVRRVVGLAALSPIAVYGSYVHGQLDMLPTALMFASALMLRDRRWRASGILAGLAIAAKVSSVLLAPLVLVFLWRNARFRSHLREYLLGLVPGLALTIVPAVLPRYRDMVLLNATSQSALTYVMDLGPGLSIVVLPVVYCAILALGYWFKRGNPDVTVLLITLALAAVPLLTPASPGWYLWSLPLLTVLAAVSGRRARVLVWLFWALATASLALRASGAMWRSDGTGRADGSFAEAGPFVRELGATGSVLATATVVVGSVMLVLVFRSVREQHDRYRLSQAPLAVAIAGDSGTGKDTLCISLADVFGERATSFLMGDDYHLYDRSAPLWSVTTHLHPAANDLSAMTRDALKLMHGEPVWGKHYDHSRGRFTKQRRIHERELVVINGLHALSSAQVRRAADLSVYTSMEERLRRQLKINRDVGERGHLLRDVQDSIDRRYPHARSFIEPQEALADVAFRLEPVVPLPETESVEPTPVETRVVAHLRDLSFAESLTRELIAIGGCSAWIEHLDSPGSLRMVVHPAMLTPADTAGIAHHLIDRREELFVENSTWHGDSRGVMQLIVVLALLERRTHRRDR